MRALQRLADASGLAADGLTRAKARRQPEDERDGDEPGALASVSVGANSAAETLSLAAPGTGDGRSAVPDGDRHATASADAISAALWKRAERSRAQARRNHASKPRGTAGLTCDGTGGVERTR